jgi:hypothetical protein
LPLLLVLLARVLLVALVLLARLAALLALLLAGLLTGLGLVLPLLLLARLLSRLVALAALVIRHMQSPPDGFPSPKLEPSTQGPRSVKCVEFQRFLAMRPETKHVGFHGVVTQIESGGTRA